MQDEIAQQSAKIVSYRAPSFGKFGTSLQTQYWFGIPRNVQFSGMIMDVDLITHQTVEKENSNQAFINYNRAISSRYSAMEHLVPEQMFSTEEALAQGVSAVKALAIAAAEGQRIYTIIASNVEQVLGSISLGTETEQEIRNAAYNGMVITTHQNQIDFYGWIGEGYIILDPQTGAGAYKIAGGNNGGWTSIKTALEALLYVLTGGSALGDYLERIVKPALDKFYGGVFASVGRILGALGIVLTGIDAALSGCGFGAVVGIVIFGVVGLAFSLLATLYLGPVGVLIASVVISILTSFIQSQIKEDFC